MSKYQNQDVTVIRDAKQGDAGFDANASPAQALIKLANGTEKVVARSEVTGN